MTGPHIVFWMGMAIDVTLGPPLACTILMGIHLTTLVGRQISSFSMQFNFQLAAVGEGRQGL